MTDTRASSTRKNIGIITRGDSTVHGNVRVLISHNYGYKKSEGETIFLTRKTEDPAQIRYKFCGNSRKAIIGEIHESLQNSEKTSTILFAVDGMGKTTTGIMYWKMYAKQYKHLIWITASSAEQIEFWFRIIAENLKLTVNQQGRKLKKFDMLLHEIYCHLLKPHLNDDVDADDEGGRKKCLLIFDDADLTIIQKYLPPEEINPAVAILIITNTCPSAPSSKSKFPFPGLSDSIDTIPLEELNVDYISDYIEQNVVDKTGRSEVPEDKKKELMVEASKLKTFGCGHPLALHQIIDHINQHPENKCSLNPHDTFMGLSSHYGVSEFAEEFENQQLSSEKLSPPPADDSNSDAGDGSSYQSTTIFTVWDQILQEIKKSKFSGLALGILRTMQLLNCDGIPSYLIYSLFPMKPGCKDVDSAINLLCKHLVIRDHEGKHLSILRVFQKIPLPVPVRPEEGQFSMSKIVKGLMPALFKLISDERYSSQMFEGKMRSFWRINLQEVHRHIENSAESNGQPGSGSGFSKEMFWSHGDHCTVSKGCVAVQLYAVLVGGAVMQELYKVLVKSPVKLDGHDREETLAQWMKLKLESQLKGSGSSTKSTDGSTRKKLISELYSVITTIDNPPVKLMMISLQVISLANAGRTKQGAGLESFFTAFKIFLTEFKNIKLSPEITTKFCAILGIPDEDLITSSTGTGSSSNNGSRGGCGFPWSSSLNGDKIDKLKEWMKLMTVFLKELKSSSETPGENVDNTEENKTHRMFPEGFVEANEKFFMTVIEGSKSNTEVIYVWFVWLYNAFRIVAQKYPGNAELLTVLRDVGLIYGYINP